MNYNIYTKFSFLISIAPASGWATVGRDMSSLSSHSKSKIFIHSNSKWFEHKATCWMHKARSYYGAVNASCCGGPRRDVFMHFEVDCFEFITSRFFQRKTFSINKALHHRIYRGRFIFMELLSCDVWSEVMDIKSIRPEWEGIKTSARVFICFMQMAWTPKVLFRRTAVRAFTCAMRRGVIRM